MSKLLESFKTLTENEWHSFDQYIHSPYFCRHEETLLLYACLSPFFPAFDVEEYAQFSQVYPERNLSRARVNVLKTYLLGHLHGFLMQENLKKHPLQSQALLIDELISRKQYKQAQKELATAETHLQEKASLDSNHLSDALKLREQQLDWVLSTGMRSQHIPIDSLFTALDSHYLTFGIKYLLPAWTMTRMYGNPFPTDHWQRFQEMVEAGPDRVSPLGWMYFHLMHLLQEGGDKHLLALQELLDAHANHISKVEQMNLYGYLQNYLTHRMLRGEDGAIRQLFELYQRLEQLDLIFGREDFTGHLVRNITVIGCRLGELGWTQQFLELHKSEIEQSLGGNTFAYSRAYLDFYLGEYSRALRHLHALEFVDPFYRTGHQVLLLRIYYELDEFSQLEAISGTFRRYLMRSRSLSARQKEANLNFISLLRKLAAAKEKGLSRHREGSLRSRLAAAGEITDRTWLRAKFEELTPG